MASLLYWFPDAPSSTPLPVFFGLLVMYVYLYTPSLAAPSANYKPQLLNRLVDVVSLILQGSRYNGA